MPIPPVFRCHPERPEFNSTVVSTFGRSPRCPVRQGNGKDRRSSVDVRDRVPRKEKEMQVVTGKKLENKTYTEIEDDGRK